MRISKGLVKPLILSLVMATSALAQPPDHIPNSLIPPLKVQPAQTAGRVADVVEAAQMSPANRATTNRPSVAGASAPPTRAPYSEVPAPSNDYDARLAIWNSPEMVDARNYVLEYSQHSARSSFKEGEKFLAQVSRLSPSEMTNWLERLQARRAAIARQQEVTSAARQFALERAARRLEEARQAQANINQWQSLIDMYLQDQLQWQHLSSQEQRSLRESGRANAIIGQRLLFDPFAPTLDPASPSRRTRAYAAASLPGDLPRGDPRNFIRGEEGISTGESSPGQNGGAVAAPAPVPAAAAEAASAPSSGE